MPIETRAAIARMIAKRDLLPETCMDVLTLVSLLSLPATAITLSTLRFDTDQMLGAVPALSKGEDHGDFEA